MSAIKALNPQLKLDRTRNDRSTFVRVPQASEDVADLTRARRDRHAHSHAYRRDRALGVFRHQVE